MNSAEPILAETVAPPPSRPKTGYRAISPWAVASVVLGVLSLSLVLGWMFFPVPLAGVGAGWLALRQIRRMRGETIGMTLAHAGMALSVVFGLAGALYQQLVVHQVPAGYKKITFEDLQPDPRNPQEFVPPEILKLQPTPNQDQKVFIKGYMYPGRRTHEIREFVLVPTVGHCSFCFWNIRSTELVQVKLTGDLTVNFRNTEIGVGGRLHVDEEAAKKQWGQVPYTLEADYVQE
jgi:hypothetical protein